MMILFVAVQSFLSSKHNRTLGAGIGEHVWKMFALNVLKNIPPGRLWLCATAESTNECSVHVVHKILIQILTTGDLTWKHNNHNKSRGIRSHQAVSTQCFIGGRHWSVFSVCVSQEPSLCQAHPRSQGRDRRTSWESVCSQHDFSHRPLAYA